MSQSRLMQTFVEDLLDLNLMRAGVFKLKNFPFDPCSIIQMVKNVFQPQAAAKKILITVRIGGHLKLPQEMMHYLRPSGAETQHNSRT